MHEGMKLNNGGEARKEVERLRSWKELCQLNGGEGERVILNLVKCDYNSVAQGSICSEN